MNVMESNPCALCDGLCCKSHIVPLTAADVTRISELGGVSAQEFIEFIPVGDFESNHAGISLEGTYQYMVLKRNDKKCVFFGKDGRCQIHADKPMLCRLYPFFYAPFGDVLLRHRNVCKVDWQLDDGKRTSIKKLWETYQRELSSYNELVLSWNQSKGKDDKLNFFREILL